MTRPITFRVKDSVGDGLYMLVTIYPTPEEMHAAYRRWQWANDEPDGWFNWDGACAARDLVSAEDGSQNPSLGRVFLHRGALGSGTVTHEMTHAAFAFWRRRRAGGKPWCGRRAVIASMPREEEFCHTLSDLTRSAVDKMYDLGLYEEEKVGATG
jgi:hypothetical protein